jgi:hypothetical protein
MTADEDIVDEFRFLEYERGFHSIRQEYSAAHFGNAIVEYLSPGLRIQVTKDRGQFFCCFATVREPFEWFDQETVFCDLGEERVVAALIAQRWSSLGAVARAVRESLDRVFKQFEDGNYPESRRRFKALQQARVRRLLGDKIADQLAQKLSNEDDNDR